MKEWLKPSRYPHEQKPFLSRFKWVDQLNLVLRRQSNVLRQLEANVWFPPRDMHFFINWNPKVGSMETCLFYKTDKVGVRCWVLRQQLQTELIKNGICLWKAKVKSMFVSANAKSIHGRRHVGIPTSRPERWRQTQFRVPSHQVTGTQHKSFFVCVISVQCGIQKKKKVHFTFGWSALDINLRLSKTNKREIMTQQWEHFIRSYHVIMNSNVVPLIWNQSFTQRKSQNSGTSSPPSLPRNIPDLCRRLLVQRQTEHTSRSLDAQLVMRCRPFPLAERRHLLVLRNDPEVLLSHKHGILSLSYATSLGW